MQSILSDHRGWHLVCNKTGQRIQYCGYKEVDPEIYGMRTIAEYSHDLDELKKAIDRWEVRQ